MPRTPEHDGLRGTLTILLLAILVGCGHSPPTAVGNPGFVACAEDSGADLGALDGDLAAQVEAWTQPGLVLCAWRHLTDEQLQAGLDEPLDDLSTEPAEVRNAQLEIVSRFARELSLARGEDEASVVVADLFERVRPFEDAADLAALSILEPDETLDELLFISFDDTMVVQEPMGRACRLARWIGRTRTGDDVRRCAPR